MNLRQLEVFIAVADSRSFSKGAEATFITQSTVSQNISALEEEFGIKLFDRTGKGAVLTAGGKVLLERARRVLHYAMEIPPAMDRFKGLEEASLRIAGSSIPGEYLLPPLLPLLLARYPGLNITLTQGNSQQIHDWIMSEHVEYGVVGGHVEKEGLEVTPLTVKDEIVLVAPSGHRWANGGPIPSMGLLDEPFVVREAGSGTGQNTISALRNVGISAEALRKVVILGSNNAIKHAVISGVGVSFVSAISVEDELQQGLLVRVPIEGVTINNRFYLVKRKKRKLSPAANIFYDVIMESYGK